MLLVKQGNKNSHLYLHFNMTVLSNERQIEMEENNPIL